MKEADLLDLVQAVKELTEGREQTWRRITELETERQRFVDQKEEKIEAGELTEETYITGLADIERRILSTRDDHDKSTKAIQELMQQVPKGKARATVTGGASAVGFNYQIDLTQPRFTDMVDRITSAEDKTLYLQHLERLNSGNATGAERGEFFMFYTHLDGKYPPIKKEPAPVFAAPAAPPLMGFTNPAAPATPPFPGATDPQPRREAPVLPGLSGHGLDERQLEAIAAAAKSATLDVLSSPRGEIFAEYKVTKTYGTKDQITRDVQERYTALLGKRTFGNDNESEVNLDVLVAALNECQKEFSLSLLGTLRLLRTSTTNMALSLCNDALRRHHDAPETVSLESLIETFRSLSYHATTQAELRSQLHAIKFKAKHDKTVTNVAWIYQTCRTLNQAIRDEAKIALIAVEEISDWINVVFQRPNALHSLTYAIRYAGPNATMESLVAKIVNFVKSQLPPTVPDAFKPGTAGRVSQVTTGNTPAFALPAPNANDPGPQPNGAPQYAQPQAPAAGGYSGNGQGNGNKKKGKKNNQVSNLNGLVPPPNQQASEQMPSTQQLQMFWKAAQNQMNGGGNQGQQQQQQQQQGNYQGNGNNGNNRNGGNGGRGQGNQNGYNNGNNQAQNQGNGGQNGGTPNQPSAFHTGCFRCNNRDHSARDCTTYGNARVNYRDTKNQCGRCGGYHPSFPCVSPIAQAGYGDGSIPVHPRADARQQQGNGQGQNHTVSAMNVVPPNQTQQATLQ